MFCCVSEKIYVYNYESVDKFKYEFLFLKIISVFLYVSGKLFEDIVIWLLIGLVFVVVIKMWVFIDFLM